MTPRVELKRDGTFFGLLPVGIFLIYLGLVAAFAFLRPYYNYDLLAYVALAIDIEEADDRVIQYQAYDEIRSAAPEKIYAEFVNPLHPARAERFRNVDSFSQWIDLYRVRPAYIFTIYGISKLGVPVVTSSILVSVLSSIAFCLILFSWLRKYLNEWRSAIATAILCTSAGLPDVARLSTPDSFSSAILVAAFYLLFERKDLLWGCMFLCLSILARTDNLLVVMATLSYLRFFLDEKTRITGRAYFILSTLSIGMVLFLHIWHQNYVEMDYFSLLAQGVKQLLINDLFSPTPYFLGLGLATAALASRNMRKGDMVSHLNLIMVISMILRFLLFPQTNGRFFVVQNALIGVSFLVAMFARNEKPHGAVEIGKRPIR